MYRSLAQEAGWMAPADANVRDKSTDLSPIRLQRRQVEHSQGRLRRDGTQRYAVYREDEQVEFGRHQASWACCLCPLSLC